jgi:osmotically-inducible protein OsmY
MSFRWNQAGPLRVSCIGECSEAGAIKEAQLESMSREEAYESAPTGRVPAPDAVHFPSQFEFGADDKHNWEGRKDERIKLAVMTALHWDLAVPRDRVQVSVHRGWVTLTGRVMREYEKDRAEADARMTAGVAGVVNRLTCEAGK